MNSYSIEAGTALCGLLSCEVTEAIVFLLRIIVLLVVEGCARKFEVSKWGLCDLIDPTAFHRSAQHTPGPERKHFMRHGDVGAVSARGTSQLFLLRMSFVVDIDIDIDLIFFTA